MTKSTSYDSGQSLLEAPTRGELTEDAFIGISWEGTTGLSRRPHAFRQQSIAAARGTTSTWR